MDDLDQWSAAQLVLDHLARDLPPDLVREVLETEGITATDDEVAQINLKVREVLE